MKRAISIRIDKDLEDQLDEACLAFRLTRSALIHALLADFLAKDTAMRRRHLQAAMALQASRNEGEPTCFT